MQHYKKHFSEVYMVEYTRKFKFLFRPRYKMTYKWYKAPREISKAREDILKQYELDMNDNFWFTFRVRRIKALIDGEWKIIFPANALQAQHTDA